jgi:hypothetical protein
MSEPADSKTHFYTISLTSTLHYYGLGEAKLPQLFDFLQQKTMSQIANVIFRFSNLQISHLTSSWDPISLLFNCCPAQTNRFPLPSFKTKSKSSFMYKVWYVLSHYAKCRNFSKQNSNYSPSVFVLLVCRAFDKKSFLLESFKKAIALIMQIRMTSVLIFKL